MTRAGVKRVVLVSAAVLFPEKGLYFAFFRWLLTHVRRDLGTAEEIVRATSLDWTIVRPPRLLNRAEKRIAACATRFRPAATRCRSAQWQPSCVMP